MKEQLFNWNQIGDLQDGRPNLGPNTRVEVYRMLQFSMREVLVEELGDEGARKILFKSGHNAGWAFSEEWLNKELPFNKFLALLHSKLEEFNIGIMRVEKADMDTMNFVVTMSEDLDCSGLPVNGTTVCDFDEGFLKGVFGFYTGKNFQVKEIDCWSTGERTCRFSIQQVEE
jgi:uncharacterized protein